MYISSFLLVTYHVLCSVAPSSFSIKPVHDEGYLFSPERLPKTMKTVFWIALTYQNICGKNYFNGVYLIYADLYLKKL